MFSRRVFGGSPDSFKLLLEFGSPSLDYSAQHQQSQQHTQRRDSVSGASMVRLPVALATLEFEFNGDEPEAAILERFVQRTSALLLDRIEEHVLVQITTPTDPPRTPPPLHGSSSDGADISAGHESSPGVSLRLSVACRRPVLRTLHFSRVSGSGFAPEAAMQVRDGPCA